MAVYALGDVEPRIDPTAYVHPDAVLIGNVEVCLLYTSPSPRDS